MGIRLNLFCNKQIAVNDKYRDGWDRTFGKKKEGKKNANVSK